MTWSNFTTESENLMYYYPGPEYDDKGYRTLEELVRYACKATVEVWKDRKPDFKNFPFFKFALAYQPELVIKEASPIDK